MAVRQALREIEDEPCSAVEEQLIQVCYWLLEEIERLDEQVNPVGE